MYKKPRIGAVRLDGWALLAPMAGVSDLAYRVIAHRMGAALTTAEMVSAKGLYYKNEKTEDMLKIDPGEHPVALQLFGSDPEIMALGAKEMEKAGPDIIDINMGCPMQKVVKNGDGHGELHRACTRCRRGRRCSDHRAWQDAGGLLSGRG